MMRDDRMPPAKIHKALTPEQKELFRRWIAEERKYRDTGHSAARLRTDLPNVKQSRWPKNPIDRFILTQLEQKKAKAFT